MELGKIKNRSFENDLMMVMNVILQVQKSRGHTSNKDKRSWPKTIEMEVREKNKRPVPGKKRKKRRCPN